VRRAQIRLALIAVVVVALVVGAVAIYRSQVFDVRTVEVVGATQLRPEDVISRAAVPADATLLRFSAGAIKERVLADPWVKDATITRSFPHTLRIRIDERAALGVVNTGVGLFVVDGEGFVLAEQSAEATTTLPTFRDTPGLDLKVGRKSTSEVLANALAALNGIGTEIGVTVLAVTAPTIDETMFITADNVEIMVGEADEMPKKALIVRQILREQAGSVVFIDVRSTERPVSRGLPEQ
jgi:cell division protein FtsQ